jgi:hypothetical protein
LVRLLALHQQLALLHLWQHWWQQFCCPAGFCALQASQNAHALSPLAAYGLLRCWGCCLRLLGCCCRCWTAVTLEHPPCLLLLLLLLVVPVQQEAQPLLLMQVLLMQVGQQLTTPPAAAHPQRLS